GTVGTADFDRFHSGSQNTATVQGGKYKGAVVPLTINATAFSSPNLYSRARCTAQVTISGPGGDVETSSNTTNVVIDVIDLNDF
ncbi:MAG TPA: hypothetical protein VL403_16040, partial [Candidatus Kryptonia bacterium]|nr:hypothetical protein [Candidatus Kryptonia bacterium]